MVLHTVNPTPPPATDCVPPCPSQSEGSQQSAIGNRQSAIPPTTHHAPSTKHPVLRLLACAILIVIALWWSLHFPFDAERLYRAVPADSSIVTEHQALGPRWSDIAGNPLILAAVGATNATAAAIPGGILAPETCRIVQLLAPRRTVAAYTATMGLGGEPVWVLASYAGAKAQLVRWALSLGFTFGMQTVHSDGIVTWAQEDRSREAGRYLSIGTSDGILVACLSNVREAAAIVLRRMETRAPLADVLQQRMDRPDDGAPDRFWLRWRTSKGAATIQNNVAIRLDTFTAAGLRGSLTTVLADGDAIIRDTMPDSAKPWDYPRRFIPDPAVAVALLEPAGPRPFASFCSDAPISVRIVASALDRMSAPKPAAFAALFHDDLGGRLLGLKVPAIVLGIRARTDANVAVEVRRVLDSLNAANRWGLLPREITLDSGRPLTIVDSSSQDLIACLAERERPAVAMHNEWILLSSCAATLDKLIACMDPPGFQRDPRWARSMDPTAPAALWLNAAAVEPAVRHTLAVYEISLMMGDPRKARQARSDLDPIRRWTAALAELKTIRFTMSSEGSVLTGHFAAGPEE
jgi:hypothetical protein